MSTVYQHQLHAHKLHRPRTKWWLASGFAVLIVAGFVGWHSLKPDTTITNAAAVTKAVAGQTPSQTFTKGSFTIDLPRGWQFTSEQQDIYTIYHFKSALSGEAGNRSLDVYEDSNLPNFAINRMVPVVPNGEGGLIAQSSEISDNCTAYTTGSDGAHQTAGTPAKWQGITFLCDVINPLRNVVGIGSADGLNRVNLNSLSAPHHYFMTYTENNTKPDYSVFIAAINSFKVQQ